MRPVPVGIPRGGEASLLSSAIHEMEHASGQLEQRHAELKEELLVLARRLDEKSKSLGSALAEKDRLARLLDLVLESIEAGVVLLGPEEQIVAANAASKRLKVVVGGKEHPLSLSPLLSGSRDRDGVLLPEGEGGPAWDLRWSRISLGELGESSLLLVQDVTRLVRLEESARRQSSLEALGRMGAELAHEVRNPLGALELCATMLVEDLEEQPDKAELAEQILLGVQQLGGTVTRLLSTVRKRPADASLTDAAALGREVVSFLAPVARSRGIELAGPLPEQIVDAELDAEGLRQALLNLLGNALEVTPEGGQILLSVTRAAEGLQIDVADSGPGVPLRERARIFEPFYSARKDGTGLGLAVVERVATAHGGRVDVLDGPLGGAVFRMSLPLLAVR